MGLSAYKQIRFPACPGTFGNVTLVINRPGNADLSQAATDTLLLGEGGEYYPFIVDGDFSLSKKFTTTRGRRALDDLNVAIRDGLSYTGTVDGSPVTEDFTSAFMTFFDTWFDESTPYKAFLLYHDNATGNDEVTHIGWIDPTYKPSSDPIIFHPLTDQQIWVGTRTIKMTALAQAQIELTWNDVLKLIGEADTLEGTPYNGFMYVPQGMGYKDGTRINLFSSDRGGLMQAVPYKQLDWSANPVFSKVDAAVWPETPWVNLPNQIAESEIWTSGSGGGVNPYAPGDTGTVDGGSTLATYEVLTVDGDGDIVTYRLTSGGAGYSVATNVGTTATSGTGVGFELNITKVQTGILWGPSGLVFIRLSVLFEKIAEAMGVDAPTVTSALRWWQQISTGNCFPIDTANPVPTDFLFISLNVYGKSHPHDGSYWDNPVGWSFDTPITDVLSGLCNMILCDFNLISDEFGVQTLVLTPMGETSGTLPEWQLIGTPQQEEPATVARSVQAKYRGDDLTIQSPIGVVGDSSQIEIPARIHRIGKTSGSDLTPDKECLIFDSAIDIAEQADNCFKVSWYEASTGETHIMPDCWKSLCYLYRFWASDANPGVYPSNWDVFGGGSDWSSSFFAINAITRAKNPDGTDFTAAADLQAELNGNDYFTLRNYVAVAFAALTLPSPNIQSFTFAGISDSSGSIQSVKTGLSAQWRFGAIADQNWVGIQIDQLLLLGQTTIKFQQYPAENGFPALTDLSYGPVLGTGGTSSTTGSGTGGGSVGTNPTVGWFPVFEELIGTKDGVNDTFTISKPRRAGFPFRIVNQLQLEEGTSFTYSEISGVGTVVFINPDSIPNAGDYVTADYFI